MSTVPSDQKSARQASPPVREKGDRMATDSTRMLAGRCECRAVRYLVSDSFLYAANCHCSNCRASTGSAFKPFAGIEREKLRVVGGAGTLLAWGAGGAH